MHIRVEDRLPRARLRSASLYTSVSPCILQRARLLIQALRLSSGFLFLLPSVRSAPLHCMKRR
jgi:hypothetical protein